MKENSVIPYEIASKLIERQTLSEAEWRSLLESDSPELAAYLQKAARKVTDEVFGREIFLRGLIEFTNICRQDCYYCGIRCSNKEVRRYRLTEEEILSCCEAGYASGLRTFVLQGGEDAYFTDERLCRIVEQIHQRFPECAITLSVGVRNRESYEKLYAAGAERFLLRQETSDKTHFEKLHPREQSLSTRVECLRVLKEIGYQTGCGFLVGSPYQTIDCMVKDLLFLQEFRPHMVGIGPFIPAGNTPFEKERAGSVPLTLFLLSCIRLMLPEVLLPATTALATLGPEGRMQGLLHGANVIMPNLSPRHVRKLYSLYEKKGTDGTETAEHLERLRMLLEKDGFTVATTRGDAPGFAK